MIAFSLSTFLITIVNVGVLFFVLRAVLFKPVTKFMEDRSAKIADALAQSEKERNQAKALLAQYEGQLKSAESEAVAIIRAAKENAQIEADRIIAEGRLSAENILGNAKKQIEAEQRAALAEFRKEAAELVTLAAGGLVKREFKADDNKQYAEMLLKEAAAGLPSRIGKN
ncbi:F0F1 ATP synthase subunit B [Leadbettera azotonutricia]|uniref:ATP synthase subunit b n=1 Tax=Leadbettera azotonutricia (strain ATCC BAA-888 / DSM 13862 / ZAS-9) TaxID=545695 RepID=F5YCF8_LEAAZ|nr:F0F1 ATP synthase subunit B [Leadbettera azotonutricia]AEF82567.1 F0F1-type ATP synthase b subunit [Leadbettera azotonutricia ZAS-9]